MRKFFKRDKATPIDDLIAQVMNEMQQLGVHHPGYPKMLETLDKLYGIKAKERRTPLSNDTIAIVIGNLAGILLVVVYEQAHVITSKAINQVLRPK